MDASFDHIDSSQRGTRGPQTAHVCLVSLAVCLSLVGCSPAVVGVQPMPTVPPLPTPTTRPIPRVSGLTPIPTVIPARSAVPTAQPTALPSLTRTVAPVAAATAPTVSAALPASPQPTQGPLSLAQRQQLFDEVWQIVNSQYLYADFNGIDWQAVRETYEPRIRAAPTNDEFYAELAEMIALLGDQHSRFVPPAAAVQQDAAVSGHESSVGIGVVALPEPEGAFIQLVFPNSPAARADLQPRDRITAVDGRPYRVEDGNFQGAAGSQVRLNVVRPGAKPRDVVLVRQQVQGRIMPTYRRFPGAIGYIWISTLWVNDMDEQVSGALTELVAADREPLQGLIIDLRGNPGGWRPILSGILSHFVRGQVGKFYSRNAVEALTVSPPAGPDLRGLPLVVLIDRDTASYAEVLAAILQHEAHAVVVGTPSAGNTETIYAHTLPDGSRLWLSQEGFRLQNDVTLEGRGVQPDVLINVNWKRYSEEDDPQLLDALRLLGAGPK